MQEDTSPDFELSHIEKRTVRRFAFAVAGVGLAALMILGGIDQRRIGETEQKDTALNTQEMMSVRTLSDETEFYTISARYPVDSRDRKNEVEHYVKYIVSEKQKEWSVGGEAYNEERKLASLFPDRPIIKYELAIDFKTVSSQKIGTTSYVLEAYSFTGGAHGGTNLATFTFGREGRIAVEDILNFNDTGNDIVLTRLLKTNVLEVLGEYAEESMVDTGLGLAYLKADGVTLDLTKCQCDGFFFPSNFQNFTVTDEGLVVIMNQYQVAPYAMGMPEILMRWASLAPFMNPDFSLPLD